MAQYLNNESQLGVLLVRVAHLSPWSGEETNIRGFFLTSILNLICFCLATSVFIKRSRLIFASLKILSNCNLLESSHKLCYKLVTILSNKTLAPSSSSTSSAWYWPVHRFLCGRSFWSKLQLNFHCQNSSSHGLLMKYYDPTNKRNIEKK